MINEFNNEQEVVREEQNMSMVEYNNASLDFNDNIEKSIEQQMMILGNTFQYVKQVNKDMKEMYKSMKIIENKAEQAVEKSELAIKKLEENVFLSDGEVDELFNIVREKSIYITKSINYESYFPNAKDFGDAVGRVRRGVWSIITRKFGVNKYIKIKHIHYQNAVDFADAISVRDYMKYRHRNDKSDLKFV